MTLILEPIFEEVVRSKFFILVTGQVRLDDNMPREPKTFQLEKVSVQPKMKQTMESPVGLQLSPPPLHGQHVHRVVRDRLRRPHPSQGSGAVLQDSGQEFAL